MSTLSTRCLLRAVCVILLLLAFSGCPTFQGERQLISSDKEALDKLSALEGVWIGGLESQDEGETDGEIIARLFRARDGKYKVNLNLFDPKRTSRVRNEVFEIDVMQAQGGLVVFAHKQQSAEGQTESLIWFVEIDGGVGKVYVAPRVQPNSEAADDLGIKNHVFRSAADIARLKTKPFEVFDNQIWYQMRFLETRKFVREGQRPEAILK
jgi:hypothetical protein